MGTEGWGRAIHDKDCVLCWLVINKSLKLSSALFLHSICILEEGIEILWITVLMVQLSRCAFLSQPLLLVITFNACEIWQEPQASPSCEAQLKTKLKCFRFIFSPFLPLSAAAHSPGDSVLLQTQWACGLSNGEPPCSILLLAGKRIL